VGSEPVYDEATKVDAENGEVVLRGPDGVAVSMTPKAAQETAHRLRTGADKAAAQDVTDSTEEPEVPAPFHKPNEIE
jgi:hypothetical protein